MPIALQVPTVLPNARGAMPIPMKASPVSKPFRQRVAARIEKNPYAPAVQETTYVGERDRKLLDRKERNRKSAARSNLRRKQARLTLERNLAEANAKVENLKLRQAELKAENDACGNRWLERDWAHSIFVKVPRDVATLEHDSTRLICCGSGSGSRRFRLQWEREEFI